LNFSKRLGPDNGIVNNACTSKPFYPEVMPKTLSFKVRMGRTKNKPMLQRGPKGKAFRINAVKISPQNSAPDQYFYFT